MDVMREAARAAFLTAAGWGTAPIAPLAGDASPRRYFRLAGATRDAVLMDAPRERGEDTGPFVLMTQWLRAQHLSAPEILASDPDAGFLLLEDLGDALFASHVAQRPADETMLYDAAVRLLVRLADIPPAAHLPPYDRAALTREAMLFAEWWLPAATPDPSTWRQDDYAALVAETMPAVEHARDVSVLRDYHAENLLWLPDRDGHARVGLLDYQDALAGHAAYDLMSLLEDARRDTSDALQEAMIALYLAERPDLDADAFRRAYAILGAQRNLKIVGIFARLALRDGKPRYLDLIPRVWGHVQRDLAHPDLTALRDWVNRHAPPPTADVLARLAAQVAEQAAS